MNEPVLSTRPTEIVLLARVDELPRPSQAPIPGLTVRRAVGVNGTRLSASLGDEVLGYIEVETNLADGGRLAQLDGWADIGNLHVSEPYRRRGIATWLVGQAADWLRLARVERLLDYAWAEQADSLALLRRLGFRELTRTTRGWVYRSGSAPEAGGQRSR
jgi:ribosomal protein S18 acetylase RimI-like enzyme